MTIWIQETAGLAAALTAAGARPVETEANVELRRAAGDAPLAFARPSGGVLVANPVRVYLDLLGGADAGGARAARLRRVLVGR